MTKNYRFLIFPLMAMGLGLMIAVACNKDDDDGNKIPDTPTPTPLRNAYEKIIEAHAVKQAGMYDIIKAFSNNYQSQFLSQDLTYSQIDDVFQAIERATKFNSELEAAIVVFENGKSAGGGVKSKGIGDALRNFATWASGSGQRSRDRILTVSSNLNANERTALYNNLRQDWKGKTQNEADFWNKLQKGDFDYNASQMYNDFYHYADSDFGALAVEKGLTMQQIVVREGAEGIKNGAAVIIETTKMATPLGQGMDMVEKAKEYAERAEHIYNDPGGALVSEVKTAVASELGGFVDIDGAVDASGLGEEFGTALKVALDAALGSDDPATWVSNALDWGAAKLFDADKPGKKCDVAFAESNSTNPDQIPQVVIGLTDDVTSDEKAVEMALPSGNWTFNVIDLYGSAYSTVSTIIAQVMNYILVSTISEPGTPDPPSGECPSDIGIKIGEQCWMNKNLDVDVGNNWWPQAEYCAEFDEYENCINYYWKEHTEYGRLYDWESALSACPPGWHLPSDDEWQQLRDYLGGWNVAGGKLKSTQTGEWIKVGTLRYGNPDGHPFWYEPNSGATNQSGFSALPGGFRRLEGEGYFALVGRNAYWWTATDFGQLSDAVKYSVSSDDANLVGGYNGYKTDGYSVRCLRD